MDHSDSDDPRRGRKSARIGERQPIQPVPAVWWVPAPTLVRPRRRRSVPVTVTDVSVTGVGVLMAEQDAPAVGVSVQMDIEGVSGELRVKVVRPAPEAGLVVCGTELSGMGNPLLDEVIALLGDAPFVDDDTPMRG